MIDINDRCVCLGSKPRSKSYNGLLIGFSSGNAEDGVKMIKERLFADVYVL